MSFLNDFNNYQGVNHIFNTNEFFCNDFTNYQGVIREALITKGLTKFSIPISFLNDFTNYQGVKQIFNTNEFFLMISIITKVL